MKAPSLRLRLLLVSAASIAFALLIAGIAIAATFANHVERSLRTDLEAQLVRLVALVDPDLATPRLTQPMPDPRYETPAGGIYWQIKDPDTGALTRSRSLWDAVLILPTPLPEDGTIVAAHVDDPGGDEALALGRRLSFERDGTGGDRMLEIMVAQGTHGIESANAAFRSDLVRALAILAVALIGATWLQVTLGLSPLGIIKRGIGAIRSGQAKALEGDFALEVMPLVSEVNDLLAAQERSIEFARERAADLAHGLKTSLTLLNGQAYALRQSRNEAAANMIETLTAGMSEAIDHQLRLSRLRHRSRSDFRCTPVAHVARKVIAAVRMTPEGRKLNWHSAIPDQAIIALDTMDLTELLGVVLENAAKWARQRVSISAAVQRGQVSLRVEDDGPGLDDQALATLGERGRRIDEMRSGSGIGLSIAREIIALNDGSLTFARGHLGGLQVDIVMQAGRAASPPSAWYDRHLAPRSRRD